MPLLAESKTNISQINSVVVKRRPLGKVARSSKPTRKKRKKASLKRLKKNARSFGERYDIGSQEYKNHIGSSRGTRRKEKKQQRQSEHLQSHLAEKEAKKSTTMDPSPAQDRNGAMAWNNGTAGQIRTSLRAKAPEADSNLGNNRLVTGFVVPAASVPSPDSLESGETRSSPIEILSDSEESQGGMEINVEGQATPEVVNLDSDEEGDGSSDNMEDRDRKQKFNAVTSTSSPKLGDPEAHMQLQGELERHLSNNFLPLSLNKQPVVRLADLSAYELDQQYKYCFYGLARDQIDLSRPAICVECLREGHTDNTCSEKHCTQCDNKNEHARRQCPNIRRCIKCRERGHDAENCQSKLKASVICDCCGSSHHVEPDCTLRFFPPLKRTSIDNVKLWISCCACASKIHLVGDCPSLHPDQAARWSLRTFDPSQISNLSLQTGISGLEKAAENRGMRPQGRDIRPAKQRPAVNQRKTFDNESEETFIRPPVARPNQRGNINFAPPDAGSRRRPSSERYDRYDAPSGADNRSRGDWYGTDSFGQRRRSRSPDPAYGSRRDTGAGDSYRPYDPPPPQRSSARASPPRSHVAGHSDRYPYDRGPPPGQAQNWQPTAGLPARPPKSARTVERKRERDRAGYR